MITTTHLRVAGNHVGRERQNIISGRWSGRVARPLSYHHHVDDDDDYDDDDDGDLNSRYLYIWHLVHHVREVDGALIVGDHT